MNGSNEQETVRRRIIALLEERHATSLDISQSVRISEKEVYEHLVHVGKSVASRGEKLLIHPAECMKCGFVFEGRKRFRPPGRCPACKSTHLRKPAYEIVRR
ncbi:MAG TPA: transcriptional regulator [Desulfobacteraceae bacterium]|jgi:transcriptional regulator|nr:transcriptional regulator [Desulfobacteraceae bacterium]